jgi:hypothetical protein
MKTKMVWGLVVVWVMLYGGSVWGYTEGESNNFFGTFAGASTTGFYNTFIGGYAGYSNTGDWNSFLGYQAGLYNTTGYANSFLGSYAGLYNTTGYANSFIGYYAGSGNTTGYYNSFLGYFAGSGNTTGYNNSFVGYRAGYSNTTGHYNSFLGSEAGYSNTTGYSNSFLGNYAGYSNTRGSYNNFLGRHAGYWNITGSGNVFLGNAAGYNETGSNKLYIANSDTTTPLIYGEFDNKILKANGTLIIGGSSAPASPDAVGTVRATSPAENRPSLTDPREADPKPVRLGSVPLLTVDKVGTLRAGKWCSSPDGVYVTCTQNPPVVEPRDSILVETSRNRIATSGVPVLPGGTEAGGGWLTSVAENDFWLSSGAMYEEGAGRWIQESSDGKAVLVGLGEEGYQVFTLSGNAVGQPIMGREARLQIDYSGNVGLGIIPEHPLHLAGGGYSDGMSWVNGSSREYKEEIESLSTEEALDAMKDLTPVKYAYKADRGQKRVGFIAEEVPDLLATKDRKGLSPMDIVAVLTKVVQEQRKEIEEQQKTAQEQQSLIKKMEQRLLALEGKGKTSE